MAVLVARGPAGWVLCCAAGACVAAMWAALRKRAALSGCCWHLSLVRAP